LKAKAIDKLSNLKEQTQMSIQDLFYKRSNKIKMKIAAPSLVIPFKAFNAHLVKQTESVNRELRISLKAIEFASNHDESQQIDAIDVYERFGLAIDSLALDYTQEERELRVIEEVSARMEMGLKNSLKCSILQGEDAK